MLPVEADALPKRQDFVIGTFDFAKTLPVDLCRTECV
jgi:hypothetical protein